MSDMRRRDAVRRGVPSGVGAPLSGCRIGDGRPPARGDRTLASSAAVVSPVLPVSGSGMTRACTSASNAGDTSGSPVSASSIRMACHDVRSRTNPFSCISEKKASRGTWSRS